MNSSLQSTLLRKYQVPPTLCWDNLDHVYLTRIGPVYRVTWWVHSREEPGGGFTRCRLENEAFFGDEADALAQYNAWARWRWGRLTPSYETVAAEVGPA